ncbi:ABC transporter ATP-binding protein [Bacillus tianshenii]|uniref:ABC transporter ATP-binding protein n=1 Tax=Sutcliffiella tianshenii TaxID=1463404 RepID=UPI001CD5C633|nr:ABC transporter ATP-binding protein [Bacillus tianshenii]MCA1319831.1 ABC transporter ATP-binding protein [Bacillus tianshenii]
MLQIKNLSKHYKESVALDSIDLSITNGIFGLLGPNGAGKTSLMRILATLLKPTAGDIWMNSISLTRHPEKVRPMIGYLPQHFHVYPQLTPMEILDYVAVMKGIRSKSRRKTTILELLEKVNLQEKANEKVKALSHGMKQRLGIAQAFIGNPSVVILDEPTVGLDPEERLRFRNLLSLEGKNKAIILSTHVVTDIESSCYEIAVLDKGRVVLDGTVEDLLAQAHGRIWEMEVHKNEIGHLKEESLIYSIRQQHGSFIKVRILTDEKPYSGAILTQPTLEEGYLSLVGGRS